MTEREMLIAVLGRLNYAIYVNTTDYMEFENIQHWGESISVEFNEKGEIVNIYC